MPSNAYYMVIGLLTDVATTGSVVVDDLDVEDITTLSGELCLDPTIATIPAGTSVTAQGTLGWGIWRVL